jgi:hypothetical protein
VQIIGDEALYGRDYIVEPSYNRTKRNPGYTGNKTVVDKSIIIQTPLCMWIIGLVAYLFSPVFSVYISPWHWGFILFMFHGRRFVIIITGSSLSLQQKSVL